MVGSDGGQNVDGAGWMFVDSKFMGLDTSYASKWDDMRDVICRNTTFM